MHRAQKIDTLVFGNDPSALSGMDLSDGGTTPPVAMLRLIGLAGVNKVPPAQNEKFFEHLSNLMSENPLLLEKYQKIIDKKAPRKGGTSIENNFQNAFRKKTKNSSNIYTENARQRALGVTDYLFHFWGVL